MIDVDVMIFDFDGTLVRSGKDLADAVNYALQTLGLPRRDEEEIRRYIGDGVGKLLERSVGSERPDLVVQALERFMEYYGEHLLDTTDLYPGVPETLEHFRGKKKIIITNKNEAFTRRIARELGIEAWFDHILGRDSTAHAKPDPRVLEPFVDGPAIRRDRIVVIGDGVNDVLLARNAGVLCCAFLNGLTDRKDILSLNPDHAVEHMGEVRSLFQ